MDVNKTIITDYIAKGDKAVIEKWCKQNNVCISFRQAGEHTLKCLERGAGAKPHSILEKTIKNMEDTKVCGFFEGFPDQKQAKKLLTGMVGHWGSKKVTGVYLTKAGEEVFAADKWEKGENENGRCYLKLETAEEKQKLSEFFTKIEQDPKGLYYFSRLFFSGDYDIHDLLQAGEIVPSVRDMQLLKDLQEKLVKGRKEQLKGLCTEEDFNEEAPEDYQRVQHGAQHNYIAQMVNENAQLLQSGKCTMARLNYIVYTVANMSLPILMCDGSKEAMWSIIDTKEELQAFYKGKGLQMKNTWEDPDFIQDYICKVLQAAIILFAAGKKGNTLTGEELCNGIKSALPQLEAIYQGRCDGYIGNALEEVAKTGRYLEVKKDAGENTIYKIKKEGSFGTISY